MFGDIVTIVGFFLMPSNGEIDLGFPCIGANGILCPLLLVFNDFVVDDAKGCNVVSFHWSGRLCVA